MGFFHRAVLVDLAESSEAILETVANGCDVLILGASQADTPPNICANLLSEFPHVRIIVVATNADRAAMYWLGMRRDLVQNLVPEVLLDSVRRAYRMQLTD